MATIAKGTRVKCIVIGRCETALTTFSEDVRADVSRTLSAEGWRVYSVAVRVISASLVDPLVRVERLGDWDYRAEVEASAPVDHSVDGFLSVVNGAFWQACDAQPTTSAPGYTKAQAEPTDPKAPVYTWGIFALIALVLVTATGVFVAKRG